MNRKGLAFFPAFAFAAALATQALAAGFPPRVVNPVPTVQPGTPTPIVVIVSSGSISIAEPLSVDDNGGSLTVDGTVSVTDGAGALNVIVDSGTITSVPASGSSVEDDGSCPSGAASFTVISASAGRKILFMWAKPSNTDYVYIKLGTTATSSDAQFAPGQPMNFDSGVYDGRVDAFPASGTQSVCVVAR